MKKRLLSVLLAVVMIVSLLPTMAFAQEAGCTHTQKVTKITNGETYQMNLSGKNKGNFTFEASGKNWNIKNSDGKYLNAANGKLVLGNTAETAWTYSKGAFSISEKTTQKNSGYWWGFIYIPGRGSKTVTTTYYLNTVTAGKLSTGYVCAELFKTVSGEHEYGKAVYVDKTNHKYVCKNCGDVKTEAHSYDKTMHKCVCGAYDPAESSVKISVDVKEKTTKQYVGWWFWGSWKDVTTYTATIKTEAKGVKVTKVQYQLNGGRWTTGTCASSDKPIETLNVKAWDNKGNLYEYAWPEEPAPVAYNVTVQVQGDHGTATVKVGDGEPTSETTQAVKGTSLAFTAAPKDGYEFDHWEVVSGGIDIESVKNNAEITVTMPETALTLKAYFKVSTPSEYGIIVENDGHGTAKAQVDGKDVTSAAPGTTVTLVAAPDDGYQLKDWQDQRGSMRVSRTNTFKMPASEVKMKAIFQRVYTIEVVAQGHGTASASDEKSIAGRWIDLTATPEGGYKLDHWVVERGGVTIGDNNKFQVGTADVKIKAVFVADTPSAYNIIVEDDNHGTASANPTSAAPETTVTLTATPNDGYTFKEWQIARGLEADAIKDNSFTMPSNEVKVKAIFERVYNINLQTNEHGTVTATVGGEIVTTAAKDAEVTLTATSADGYQFKEWKVISGVISINDNKFTMPASNVTVQAVFEEIRTSIEKPTAVSDLIYDGEEQIGVAEGTGYTVENGKKTNAGDYTATVKLLAGYKWSDETTSDLEINWSIAKATYDMSGVTFEDKTVDYNGQEQEIKISGELPEGVEVSYSENMGKDARVYGATAKFTGDEENYEPIDDMSATLTIQKASLTATADDKNVTVGSDAPEYTITYTGWVEGESIKTVTPTIQPELVCNYTKDSPAGEYDITFTTWPDFENYDASAVDGKLTATAPAAPTFKAVAAKDTDNKYTLTFYYDAVDHSGEGITVYDNLPTAATKSGNWGYSSIRESIKSVVIDNTVANYDDLTSAAFMFCDMGNAESIIGAEYLDVSNVTDMSEMFSKFGSESTTLNVVPDVSEWKTANVTDMESMFEKYGNKSTALNVVPNVSKWETANVTVMTSLFEEYGENSTVLNAVPDVGNWKTANVTDMSHMFDKYGKSSTKLSAVPDVSKWNTAKVTKMSYMFFIYGEASTNLNFTLDLSGWSVAEVTNYGSMFSRAGKSAPTWSVTIPAKTGDQANDTTHWYVGDGDDTEKYIKPADDRQFTLAKTVADILPEDFPITEGTAWKNDAMGICYINGENLHLQAAKPTFDLPLTTAVSGSGNSFTCSDSNGTFTFNMKEGKLTSINVEGTTGGFLDGTYAPAAPKYTVTFDMNGIDDPAPNPQTITSGEKVSEPDEPADDNHTFDGWYKTKDTTTGKLSDPWTFDTDTVTENMTLYAQWTRTLESIIATNSDFPNNQSSENWIPDNPWVNKGKTGFVAFFDEDYYELIATTADNEDGSDGPVMNLNGNDLLIKVNDNYVYAFEYGAKVICYIEGEIFTSFEFEDTSDEWGILSGTYAPAAPTGNPNVFDYAGSETDLDFSTGKYGDKDIADDNPIVINNVTGALQISGDTTSREVHAFVQTGGKVTSVDSNGTIKAYLGGSEDAEGTITAGTDAVANISLGTDFTNVDDIIANTTGKISIGVSDYTKKIDLNTNVTANIEITTPLGPSITGSGVLWLGNETYGLFKNISSNDTLTYTAGASVKKVNCTVGNDIISMSDDAASLTEIDLASGGGHDTVIVNENLWKYDGSNLEKYKIDVKSGDKVKIGSVSATSYTSSTKQGSDVKADINSALGESSNPVLLYLYFRNTSTYEEEYYLVYDKDNSKSLSDGDIVIQIVGANLVSSVTDGYITFIGS